MARDFVHSKIKPKRSIIFILFSNEETGLFGSTYFTEHPLVPLEKVTAMINLDCVGFGDSIHIGNGLSAPELWKIARGLDSLYTKQMVTNTWNGGGADATPFHQKGIPCLYFVTTNSYKHLHLPSDLPETLNQNLFEKIVRLAYITALNISEGDYKREVVVQ
jgi:Zn-dependent M28 family amino/carboxypeptidase